MIREREDDARSIGATGCAIARLERRRAGTLLVVAAHPDDETVGVGATLGALVAASWYVEVLHVTDGAPRDVALRPGLRDASIAEAARIRREEVRAALRVGGLERVVTLAPSLEVPDQGAARVMAPLARLLGDRFTESPVDVVVTHPYEGGHPDHDAVAFAVHAAVALAPSLAPKIVEMSSYHRTNGTFAAGAFLSETVARVTCERRWHGFLGKNARTRKRAMLDAFSTQRGVLAAFDTVAEPLRCAPAYDFTRPPHEGTLYYEMLPFGWTGDDWCELARDALSELGLSTDALTRRRGCSSVAARG